MTPLVRARSVGDEARRALRAGRQGRVEAVFSRSCYLRFDNDWLCIGESSIGDGPLNVLVGDVRPVLGSSQRGTSLRCTERGIDFPGLAVDLAGVPVWLPDPLPAWAPERCARGLQALGAGLPAGIPAEGLAHFLAPAEIPPGPVARAAAPAVRRLAAWLASPAAPPPAEAVQGLLGLGPGLTPSGDDFLAGVLSALLVAGQGAAAGLLWGVVADLAPAATNPISLAHLRATYRSGLAAAPRGALGAVLSGDGPAIRRALADLPLSQSSPWDVLAGCHVALAAASKTDCSANEYVL